MAGSDTVTSRPWTVDEGDDIGKTFTPKAGGATVDLTDAPITAVILRWRGADSPTLLALDIDDSQLAAGSVSVSHAYADALAASNVGRTAWCKVTVTHDSFGGLRTIFNGPFIVRPQ